MIINNSTSKGNQTKYVIGNRVYKKDKFGYESISEVLVSELEHFIQDFSYIDYWFDYHKQGECFSLDYHVDGIQEITLYRLLSSVYNVDVLLEDYSDASLCNIVEGIINTEFSIDIHQYLGKVFMLDYITLNEDRHLNNISLLCSKGIYKEMPVYDNGLSLLSDINTYPLNEDIHVLIPKVKSKPFFTSFSKQLEMYRDVPMLRIDIQGFLSKLRQVDACLEQYVPFKRLEYQRARDVLLYQLKNLEDKIWKSN